jgi:hypothetical protein
MTQAVLIAALATSAIQGLVFRGNWKRRRITIERSKGRKVMVRIACVVLAFYALPALVGTGLERFLNGIAADQELKIGIGNSLIFLWVVSLHRLVVLQLVRAVEMRDGWYRLAGVHPRALAALRELQASVNGNPGT